MLAGTVVRAGETRVSPAGIPITRFTLEHRSVREEAGGRREVQCRVQVVAAGARLTGEAERLEEGAPVRVEGFLARAGAARGAASLVIHADTIERPAG